MYRVIQSSSHSKFARKFASIPFNVTFELREHSYLLQCVPLFRILCELGLSVRYPTETVQNFPPGQVPFVAVKVRHPAGVV